MTAFPLKFYPLLVALLQLSSYPVHCSSLCQPKDGFHVVQNIYNFGDAPEVKSLSVPVGQGLGSIISGFQRFKTDFQEIFGQQLQTSSTTGLNWNSLRPWIYSTGMKASYKLKCPSHSICTVVQIVGTCGPSNYLTPDIKTAIRPIPTMSSASEWEYGRHCSGKDVIECDNGRKCLDPSRLCDGVQDCSDGSDELQGMCVKTQRLDPWPICWFFEFNCGTGQCLDYSQRCDGVADCPDGSDEFLNDFFCLNTYSNRESCSLNRLACDNGECKKYLRFCDGSPDCKDGSDEKREICFKPGAPCPMNQFSCSNGTCLSLPYKCDGVQDCADGRDERRCIVNQATPHGIEERYWRRGYWSSSTRALPSLNYIIGLNPMNSVNTSLFSCRYSIQQGSAEIIIVVGQLEYSEDTGAFACKYVIGDRENDQIPLKESFQILQNDFGRGKNINNNKNNRSMGYKWASASGGHISDGVVWRGISSNYELYFVCRAEVSSFEHQILSLGVLQPSVGKCIVTAFRMNGAIFEGAYEVLYDARYSEE